MSIFERKESTTAAPEVRECERKIAGLVQRRAELVMQIGTMFLENNTAEELAGSPYEESVKAIMVVDKEVEFQEKRKLAVQRLRKCEKCGNIMVLDSVFCNKCGDKLEPLFAEETKMQSICPQCGTPHGEGALFCTSCGNKLG